MSDLITAPPKTQADEELSELRGSFKSSCPEQVLPFLFKLTSLLRQDLSAKDYYQLFLQILDGLLEFSYYLANQNVQLELLAKAQYSVEIVPRLYTTIIVGIKLFEKNTCPEILDDLIELVKGVQHPLRGLFLRFFLNKAVKNLHQENSFESIEFILKNLGVMNLMWSRIEDLEQREALQVTVGENVERLSVVCTDLELYFDLVFPRLMKILRESDLISQKYLLDCVIQAFPDDFLLKTFDEFMELACQIQQVCDVVSLIFHTLERLLRFTQENQVRLGQKSLIPLFTYLNVLLHSDTQKNLAKNIEVHGIFLKFSLNDEFQVENMVNTLENLQVILEKNTENLSFSEMILDILIDSMNINMFQALKLSSFNRAYQELSENQKYKVSLVIYEKLDFHQLSEDLQFWKNCFVYLKFLYISDDSLGARLKVLNVIRHLAWSFQLVQSAFETFNNDETFNIFIAFTALSQVRSEISFKSLLKSCLNQIQNNFIAFQICTCSIISFAKEKFDDDLLELAQKAVKLYEKVPDNSSRTLLFHSLVTIAIHSPFFCDFNEKIVGFCFKIPKKVEQCVALLALSHIYWTNQNRNPVKLLELLKRSVKLADLSVAGAKNLNLFVMILNEYVLFSLEEVPSIDVLSINSLIELIFELLSFNSDKDQDVSFTKIYLRNTLNYVEQRQKDGKLKNVIFQLDYLQKLN
jgi:vacuolar protein sorting-associated protein 35